MRRRTLATILALVLVSALLVAIFRRPFLSDQTPEGAYMRVAKSVAANDPRGFFAYLEEEAQWACFTIRDARARASARIETSYPEPRRSEMLQQYGKLATAKGGADVFAMVYDERGWSRRLRKDLSGALTIETHGDRASVITVQGTRWPFRRRANGIWGMTVFTAELVAESEKATRDLAVVGAAADDYDRARAAHPN